MKENPFKTCPMCSEKWDALDNFLADSQLKVSGYQANFENLDGGLFYFVHHGEGCGTTLGIPVNVFKELSDLPFLAPRLRNRPDDCMGLCLKRDELGLCSKQCECQWVREIMQTIRKWEKEAA